MTFNEIALEVRNTAERECSDQIINQGHFHSGHEGYAVLKEELEETEANLKDLKKLIDTVWETIKSDNSPAIQLDPTIKKGVLMAAEAIQTTAMLMKLQELYTEE